MFLCIGMTVVWDTNLKHFLSSPKLRTEYPLKCNQFRRSRVFFSLPVLYVKKIWWSLFYNFLFLSKLLFDQPILSTKINISVLHDKCMQQIWNIYSISNLKTEKCNCNILQREVIMEAVLTRYQCGIPHFTWYLSS